MSCSGNTSHLSIGSRSSSGTITKIVEDLLGYNSRNCGKFARCQLLIVHQYIEKFIAGDECFDFIKCLLFHIQHKMDFVCTQFIGARLSGLP